MTFCVQSFLNSAIWIFRHNDSIHIYAISWEWVVSDFQVRRLTHHDIYYGSHGNDKKGVEVCEQVSLGRENGVEVTAESNTEEIWSENWYEAAWQGPTEHHSPISCSSRLVGSFAPSPLFQKKSSKNGHTWYLSFYLHPKHSINKNLHPKARKSRQNRFCTKIA